MDCNGVKISQCSIDAADDGICLKSHSANSVCTNVVIRDCTIRSSANAIKFGTASYGGFSHIQIIHNKIYDTYRSAIALEAVDGGCIEDVWIDSLEAVHTGNAFFLRVGKRNGQKQSCMRNIHLSNFHINIAANKPDSGYAYEGPVEDQPRNISPIVITGQPGNPITGVVLRNMFIESPGGGNALFANCPLEKLDSIPELPAKYPEFSMFKELPAWGIYIRHCTDLQAAGVHLLCIHKDYRPAVVLDDTQQATFTDADFKGVSPKNRFYLHHSTDVVFRFSNDK